MDPILWNEDQLRTLLPAHSSHTWTAKSSFSPVGVLLMQKLSDIIVQYPSKSITYWNRCGRFCCLDFTLVFIFFNGGQVVLFLHGFKLIKVFPFVAGRVHPISTFNQWRAFLSSGDFVFLRSPLYFWCLCNLWMTPIKYFMVMLNVKGMFDTVHCWIWVQIML